MNRKRIMQPERKIREGEREGERVDVHCAVTTHSYQAIEECRQFCNAIPGVSELPDPGLQSAQ